MRLSALTLILAAGLVSAVQAAPPSKPVRVLIVTGVDTAHQWKKTAPVLRDVLEQGGRIEARIVEDPDFLASPAVGDYDVILLDFMNPRPLRHEAEVQANLARLVHDGKGLVVLHFACGALSEWPEFLQLAGKVWDRKTAHDPRGPFTVRITNADHPITRGMKDFQADDELYFCLVGDCPVNLLAVARSKVKGKDQPMAFTLQYGKGRVFHTPLGHDGKALQMPGVAELLRRGCLWTAGRLE
jgi:type 1 glutamine amidotransferase